jgi:Spy/CpxP family protein refolding chaperone
MRNLCKVSLSMALVALLASPALAQRRPGGGFGFGGQNLLTNKSVQEELKLSKEQKDKIEEVGKANREKFQKFREESRDLKEDERNQKRQALVKETTEALNKAAELSNDQKKRLAEITLQQSVRFRGPAAFSSEDVQKQLKLNDDQKDAIKTILKETEDKVKEETKDLDPRQDFRKVMEIRQKLNKEAMGTVAKKLTKDQKETWTKMLGEPFEVKFEQPRRPGGGRPGGGARPPRTDL